MFQIKMKLLGKVVADHFIIVPYFHCLIDLKEVLPRFRCLERSDCLCLFCILLLKAKDKIVFCFSLRIQLQASDDKILLNHDNVAVIRLYAFARLILFGLNY